MVAAFGEPNNQVIRLLWSARDVTTSVAMGDYVSGKEVTLPVHVSVKQSCTGDAAPRVVNMGGTHACTRRERRAVAYDSAIPNSNLFTVYIFFKKLIHVDKNILVLSGIGDMI